MNPAGPGAAVGAALLVALLAGCSGASDAPAPPSASATSTGAAGSGSVRAAFGLAGKDAVQVIDHLDRLGGPARPAGLMASVRADDLVLSSGAQQERLTIPEDKFYVSVAPYVTRTHECFYHSLTTCQGELTGKDVAVRITDASSGRVLVEETRTTFANGFVGFWLPRGVTATLTVTSDGRSAQVPLSTGPAAPTCVTTVRLA